MINLERNTQPTNPSPEIPAESLAVYDKWRDHKGTHLGDLGEGECRDAMLQFKGLVNDMFTKHEQSLPQYMYMDSDGAQPEWLGDEGTLKLWLTLPLDGARGDEKRMNAWLRLAEINGQPQYDVMVREQVNGKNNWATLYAVKNGQLVRYDLGMDNTGVGRIDGGVERVIEGKRAEQDRREDWEPAPATAEEITDLALLLKRARTSTFPETF